MMSRDTNELLLSIICNYFAGGRGGRKLSGGRMSDGLVNKLAVYSTPRLAPHVEIYFTLCRTTEESERRERKKKLDKLLGK